MHLGLNRTADASAVRGTFPLATEITLLRAYAAAALWSDTARPRWALGLGLVTDVLDGYLARRRGEATALGALLDGEYDASLWLAAARAARRQQTLPASAEVILWLRFAAPLLGGVLAYGAAPTPVVVRSRRLGKLAGLVQAAIPWAALAGQPRRATRWPVALLAVTTALAWGAHITAYHDAVRHEQRDGG